MGGCVSLSIPCDHVVNQGCQWLCLKGSSIHKLSENLTSLEKAMVVLKAKRVDVQRRVNREEFTREQRQLEEVQVWLTSVLTIENQFNDLLEISAVEVEKLCLCGFCSKNLKQSYKYGKRVIKMLEDVESLGSRGDFAVLTETTPIGEVKRMRTPATIVGQETMFERVWNHLMEDDVGLVGLYGMGGVGKTTLLLQINNKFAEISSKFDIVIWVVVSRGASISKIQKDIGDKIGHKGEEWNKKKEDQKAIDIYTTLWDKKFVLLLDDIWKEVDMEELGVPNPSRENKCKIIFTTRSIDVCGRMGVHQQIEVKCLDSENALELFKKKIRVETLQSHQDIPKLAEKIAEKCGGLPLALNVIGQTMACKKTIREWYGAIDRLTSCDADFPEMENKVLSKLKFSYDDLGGEDEKSCFLYCSLFPEDYLIEKERLVEYWICERFIDENNGREWALNRGHEILGNLDRRCLLLLDRDIETVSMHDVIREMALWITTDFGKNKNQWIVQAGVGLTEVPKKNWKDVRKLSLMDNDIDKIIDSSDCPQLTTLFLQENRILVNISGEFFRSLTKLLVLDLSSNQKITDLPEVSKLVSLRYLDLSGTNIKRLPIGFQELKMLIHLNLLFTKKLESLHGISKLSSLRTFRLQHSKVKLDMNLMKELELLEHLEYITITISQCFSEEKLPYDSKVWRCIHMVNFNDVVEESLVLSAAMINLCQFNIERCGISQIKIENTSWNKGLSSPGFSNLSKVVVCNCNGLRDLTWLMFAPNLTHLDVVSSKQIETIINEENAAFVLEKEEPCKIIPFKNLQKLILFDLPKLKSIYRTSLSFPCLQKVEIYGCGGLRDLTWLMFAPILTHLEVISSQIETIINEENAASFLEKEEPCKIIPFQKLESLTLSALPKLKNIYWTSLPFPCLKVINLRRCENLKTLSLDSQSVVKIEEFTIKSYKDEEEWQERIEWKDEDTKLRFFDKIVNREVVTYEDASMDASDGEEIC